MSTTSPILRTALAILVLLLALVMLSAPTPAGAGYDERYPHTYPAAQAGKHRAKARTVAPQRIVAPRAVAALPEIPLAGRRLAGNCSVYYYGLGGGFFGSGVTKLANEDRARGRSVATSHWFMPVDTSRCSSVKVAGHSMGGPTAVGTANAARARGKPVELNVLDTTRWQGVQVAARGVRCNHYRQAFGLGGGHVANCREHNLTGRYGHVGVPYALTNGSAQKKVRARARVAPRATERQSSTGNAFNLTIVYVSADDRYPARYR